MGVSTSICGVLVGKLALSVSFRCVLFCLFVLATCVMVCCLMVMMCCGMMMTGRRLMMLVCRMSR